MSLARLFRRRRPLPFAEWGWEVHDYLLPTDGHVQYAQWLHPSMRPREQPFVVRQPEVDALRRWIRPGDFAVDVGAHGGDTTVPMALAAGPTGCVLALEPNRYAFAVLEANAGLNRDKTHIEPRCYAATNDDGQFEFLYGDASFCNGGQAIGGWNPFRRKYPLQVEGRRLIRVLRGEFAAWLPRWSYLKVDAEGHDLAILASIMPALREWQPVIRTEVFRKLRAANRYELHDFLVEAGYEVFRYAGGDRPQGEPVARQGMTAHKHFDVLALPRRAGAASKRLAA
jgi:FkbM family methyltransferase